MIEDDRRGSRRSCVNRAGGESGRARPYEPAAVASASDAVAVASGSCVQTRSGIVETRRCLPGLRVGVVVLAGKTNRLGAGTGVGTTRSPLFSGNGKSSSIRIQVEHSLKKGVLYLE